MQVVTTSKTETCSIGRFRRGFASNRRNYLKLLLANDIVFIGVTVLLVSMVSAEKPIPVDPFTNICALSVGRINEFIACTMLTTANSGRKTVLDEFKKQASAFGDLSVGAVIRMMCRSLNDDGLAAVHEYLDALETENDKEFMVVTIRDCGGPEIHLN